MNKSKIIYLAIGALVLFLLCIIICIAYAPIFSYCVIITFVLSFGFIATEGWFTHAASEFENRFWSGMAFFFACACVFAPDSPLRLSRNVTQLSLAIPIVFAVTYLIHIYDRHLRRVVLNKVPNIMKRMRSADFNFNNVENRLNAQQKLTLLRNHLDMIDQQWLSSTFQNIFLLPRVLQIEHSIITILSEVTDDQLNFIITKVQLGRIFYKVKDHKVARRFNRTKLLELLAVTRLKELSVFGKAMLIHGFQIMKLSAHPLSEVYIKNIIFSTKEDDLSELKSLTDSKGDIYSMHKLIYEDIRDKSIKNDILNFISLQARIQQGHNTIKSRKGKKRSRLAWKKIVSDVDDTLTSSGGSYPAGVDVSYPKKALYPGVLAFYRELDLGVTGDEEWNDTLQGNLVFLSARPHVYKDMSEHITYDKFKLLQERRGLHTSPSLLAGSLNTGSKYILQDDLEPLAENKFRNLTEYIALYPEYNCILVGDNGQGDVRATEMVLENNLYRNHICRAFIHEVIPLQNTHSRRRETKTRYGTSHICYFKTYVDAAVDAYHQNLIRLSGLRRIMMESIIDFELITEDEWRKCDLLSAPLLLASSGSSGGSDVQTNYSQSASNVMIGGNNNLSKSVSNSGSGSSTGNSSTTNPTHDIYSSGGVRTRSFSTINHRYQSTKTKDKKSSLPSHQLTPESKHDSSLRDLNAALTKANSILAKHRLPLTPLKKYITRYAKGSAVKTPYGKAVVTRFRAYDGVYEVLLQWDATGAAKPVHAYLQASSISPLLPLPAPLPPSITSATSFSMSTAQLNTIMSSLTVASIAQAPASILPSSSLHNSSGAGNGTPAVRVSGDGSPRPLTAVTAAGSMASRMLGSFSFRSTASSANAINPTNGVKNIHNSGNSSVKPVTGTPVTSTPTTPIRNAKAKNPIDVDVNSSSSQSSSPMKTVQFQNDATTTTTTTTTTTPSDDTAASAIEILRPSNIIPCDENTTTNDDDDDDDDGHNKMNNHISPQKSSSSSSFSSPCKSTTTLDETSALTTIPTASSSSITSASASDERRVAVVTPTKEYKSSNNSSHTCSQKSNNPNTKHHLSPLMGPDNIRCHTPTRFSSGGSGSSSTTSSGGKEVDAISTDATQTTTTSSSSNTNVGNSSSPLINATSISISTITTTTATTITNLNPPMISLPSVSPLTVPPILGSLFSRISSSASPLTTATQPLLSIGRPRSQTASGTPTSTFISSSGVASAQVMTASFIGGMMWTPYGIGEAVDYRLRDDMVVIRAPVPVFMPVAPVRVPVPPVDVNMDSAADNANVNPDKSVSSGIDIDKNTNTNNTDVSEINNAVATEFRDSSTMEISSGNSYTASASSQPLSLTLPHSSSNPPGVIPYSYLIFSPRLQVVQITLPFLTQSPFRTADSTGASHNGATTTVSSAGEVTVLTHSRHKSLSTDRNSNHFTPTITTTTTTNTSSTGTGTDTSVPSNTNFINTPSINVNHHPHCNTEPTPIPDTHMSENKEANTDRSSAANVDCARNINATIAEVVADALDEILTQSEHDSLITAESTTATASAAMEAAEADNNATPSTANDSNNNETIVTSVNKNNNSSSDSNTLKASADVPKYIVDEYIAHTTRASSSVSGNLRRGGNDDDDDACNVYVDDSVMNVVVVTDSEDPMSVVVN